MFSFVKLQFEIEMLNSDESVGFFGDKLRGGLGTMLKDAICIQPHFEKLRGMFVFYGLQISGFVQTAQNSLPNLRETARGNG